MHCLRRSVSSIAALVVLTLGTVRGARAQATCPSVDPGFANPLVRDTVLALQSLPNGSSPALYVGGQFLGAGGINVWRTIRWSGFDWSRVGPDRLAGTVRAMAVFDSGSGPELFAGGEFYVPSGHYVARFDGVQWQGLGYGVDGPVRALCVFDDGSGPALYLGGSFYSVAGQPSRGLAKWNGATWSPVGLEVGGTVNALIVHEDSSGRALYIGGEYSATGALGFISRWNGASHSVLGGFNGPIEALASYRENGVPTLFAAGQFTSVPGISTTIQAGHIARWNGTSWSPVTTGTGANDVVHALRVIDDPWNPVLYLGGNFTSIDGVRMPAAARWDGTSWSDTGQQLVGDVRCLEAFDDGRGSVLYAGGSLAIAGSPIGLNIARFDGSNWSAISQGWPSAGAGYLPDALHMDEGSGDTWYATSAEPMRWSGLTWAPFVAPAGGTPAASCLGLGVQPRTLYFARTFTGVPGQTYELVRWDGSTASRIGSFNASVATIWADAVAGTERLFVGGSFTNTASTSTFFLARFEGGAWQPSTELLALPTGSGVVSAFGAFASDVFAVGGFTVAADGTRSVARWNGSSWVGVGSGLPGQARSITTHDFGSGIELVVAGTDSLSSTSSPYVARWNGSAWTMLPSPLVPGEGVSVAAAVEWDQGGGSGPEIFLSLNTYSFPTSSYVHKILRWTGAAWSLESTRSGSASRMRVLPHADGSGTELVLAGGFQQSHETGTSAILVIDGCGETGRTYCFGDGSGTACPCANESAVGDRAGCRNSFAVGATVRARGLPSLTQDTLRLDITSLPLGAPCLFFQGTDRENAGAGSAFGDGLRCAGGAIQRLATSIATGGNASFGHGVSGDAAIHIAGLVAVPGVHRYYQGWYRNGASFCTPSAFNLTNGVDILWTY